MYVRVTPARIAATLLVGGALLAANAVASMSSGSTQVTIQNRGDAVSSTTSSMLTWKDLPMPALTVSVPTNGSVLVNARFTAEARCRATLAPSQGPCYLRIVAQKSTGNTVLDPAGDTFRFGVDMPGVGNDRPEDRAVERSIRLTDPGMYKIIVQRKVASSSIVFDLRYWHLAVTKTA